MVAREPRPSTGSAAAGPSRLGHRSALTTPGMKWRFSVVVCNDLQADPSICCARISALIHRDAPGPAIREICHPKGIVSIPMVGAREFSGEFGTTNRDPRANEKPGPARDRVAVAARYLVIHRHQ